MTQEQFGYIKDLIKDMLLDTYKQTVEDNKEDFLRLCFNFSKLATLLMTKGVITQEELEFVVDMSDMPITAKDIDKEVGESDA